MADPVLRTQALSKSFAGFAAVSDVSIEVAQAELHAVIGPNGAGKTTLINLISGELQPAAGDIYLGTERVTHLPPDRRARAGFGRSFQHTTVFPEFTVIENVRLALQACARRPLSPFGNAQRDAAQLAAARAALIDIGLAERAHDRAAILSYGEQRRLEIAMVFAAAPRIVLLDEPLAGLTRVEKRTVADVIAGLARRCAILLVEHDTDAVFALAGRVTVMAAGRVIASGSPQEIRADPAVQDAYLGGALAAVPPLRDKRSEP